MILVQCQGVDDKVRALKAGADDEVKLTIANPTLQPPQGLAWAGISMIGRGLGLIAKNPRFLIKEIEAESASLRQRLKIASDEGIKIESDIKYWEWRRDDAVRSRFLTSLLTHEVNVLHQQMFKLEHRNQRLIARYDELYTQSKTLLSKCDDAQVRQDQRLQQLNNQLQIQAQLQAQAQEQAQAQKETQAMEQQLRIQSLEAENTKLKAEVADQRRRDDDNCAKLKLANAIARENIAMGQESIAMAQEGIAMAQESNSNT